MPSNPETKPALTMSPEKVPPLIAMPFPPTPAEIVPVFVMPPRNVETSCTWMPVRLLVEIVPLLTMLPPRVLPNTRTLAEGPPTTIPWNCACIVPPLALVMLPENVETLTTSMAGFLPAEIEPALLMSPAKEVTSATAMPPINGADGELSFGEIVPLLTMSPPALVLPNNATVLTKTPKSAPAVIVPVLVIPPANVETAPMEMPVLLAALIVPLLIMAPARVEKLSSCMP